MKAFDRVSDILQQLRDPGGCPWDREQTMESLRTTVLEETCELIEAIDQRDDKHIAEELGDLFLNAIFFCKIAEHEKRFTMESVLNALADKLIYRHPHVFGEAKVDDSAGVISQWEQLKKSEAHHKTRKSALDGIPKGLPALARVYKGAKKMKKAGYEKLPQVSKDAMDEQTIGENLYKLALTAQQHGIDPEQALRRILALHEQAFRDWEERLKAKG